MTKLIHPAKYSESLLPVMARYVDGARTILDPFAGTGRVGLLKQHLTVPPFIWANELEEAWAREAKANGCDMVRIGDARTVGRLLIDDLEQPVDAIVVSPAYGNRMADACHWAEGRKHSTYTSALRDTVGDHTRSLTPGNAGAMQWGDAYRDLHRSAWAEAARVLVPGGRLVLNVADHFRAGQLQGVPAWHVSVLLALGFVLLEVAEVATPRFGFGANADKRAPELVIVLGKSPLEPCPPWRWWPDTEALSAYLGRRPGTLWAVEPEPSQLSLLGGPTA
jgi:SAM-dependent methyltransferase